MRRLGTCHHSAPDQALATPCEPTALGPQLTLWLRSSVGVTQAGTVSSWADQSGYGNNFTQGTGAIQPVYRAVNGNFNGAPSIDMTPAGAFVACAGAVIIRHVIIVANYPGAVFSASDPALFSTAGGSIIFRGTPTTPLWGAPDIAGDLYRDGAKTAAALDVANRAHIYEHIANTATAVSAWRLGDDAGGGNQWEGSVVEVIASRELIPDRVLRSIRAGLRSRYGTP